MDRELLWFYLDDSVVLRVNRGARGGWKAKGMKRAFLVPASNLRNPNSGVTVTAYVRLKDKSGGGKKWVEHAAHAHEPTSEYRNCPPPLGKSGHVNVGLLLGLGPLASLGPPGCVEPAGSALAKALGS